ncbi:MAG: SET domain-containing protein-lysine N-methyltransferase [Phaeodactylibacter sp.]|nr:SET domain-containing protein-lysine N-methyltransferase [Phaeodactylibacter sp.]MCB9302719.1 SET domain-containing protein-lysine N-methyltransferase [Lewinellaceae bacterium]HQU59639.1 SET domain-containing protein [Saprospiraceae bacterium]
MQRIDSLYIAPSPLGGRGVFTAAAIPAGALIEICPMIVMPQAHRQHLDETGLYDYYFIWGEKEEECAIALGYGSLFNHDYDPNAEYIPDFDHNTLDFFALRDIDAGEEITVNYNGDPEEQSEIWFEARRSKR